MFHKDGPSGNLVSSRTVWFTNFGGADVHLGILAGKRGINVLRVPGVVTTVFGLVERPQPFVNGIWLMNVGQVPGTNCTSR